jgi:hypothetical protein
MVGISLVLQGFKCKVILHYLAVRTAEVTLTKRFKHTVLGECQC